MTRVLDRVGPLPRLLATSSLLLVLPGCPSYDTHCEDGSKTVVQGQRESFELQCSFLQELPDSLPFGGTYNTVISVTNEQELSRRGVRVTPQDGEIMIDADATATPGAVDVMFQIYVNGVSSNLAKVALEIQPAASTGHELRLVNANGARVDTEASGVRSCDNATCSFSVPDGALAKLMAPMDQSAPDRICKWACNTGSYSSCDAEFRVTSDTSCELTLERPDKLSLRVNTVGPGAVSAFIDEATTSNEACVDGTCFLDEEASVRLVAYPHPKAAFVGWSEDCAGQDPTESFRLTDHTVCKAEFEQKPMLQVELRNDTESYATVVAEGASISCPGECEAEVAPDSPVTLRVVRKAEINDMLEIRWGGACEGSAETTQVTVDSDKMCTVTVTPMDACAGATAPPMIALEATVGGSPLVVDRSSGIAVVQVSRGAEVTLDASGTQVSPGIVPSYTWEIDGEQLPQFAVVQWSPGGGAGSGESFSGELTFDDGCGHVLVLPLRFDITF